MHLFSGIDCRTSYVVAYFRLQRTQRILWIEMQAAKKTSATVKILVMVSSKRGTKLLYCGYVSILT